MGSVTSRLTAFKAKCVPSSSAPIRREYPTTSAARIADSLRSVRSSASLSIPATQAQAWLGRQPEHCQSHRATPPGAGAAERKSIAAAVNGLFVASASSSDTGTHSGRCCAAHHPASTIGCRWSLEHLRAPELLSATAKTLSNLRPPELLRSAVKTLGNLRSPELLGASAIPLDGGEHARLVSTVRRRLGNTGFT